jgi:hypothetical protein
MDRAELCRNLLLRVRHVLRRAAEPEPGAGAAVRVAMAAAGSKEQADALRALPAAGWALLADAFAAAWAPGGRASLSQWRGYLQDLYPQPDGVLALAASSL